MKGSIRLLLLLALAGLAATAALGGSVQAGGNAATATDELVRKSVVGKIVLDGSASDALARKKPIVIGTTLGLTGAFAGPSNDYRLVYTLWQKQVNGSSRGLLGRPVRLIIYDDQGNPAVAQSLYERLITQDKVDLVLGPYTTFIGGAVAPLILRHKKVIFNGGFTGISFFEDANGWIIGTYPSQEPEWTLALFNLISTLPRSERPQRMAILTAQNPATVAFRDGYRGSAGALNYAKRWGIDVVVNEEYAVGTTNLAPLIQEAKRKNADILLALSTPNDSALIARTVKQLDYKPKMYCSCGAYVTTLPLWRDLGDAGDNVLALSTVSPNQPNRGLKLLVDMYKRLGAPTVPSYASVAYSIMQVLQQAVTATKSLNQEKLRSYILASKFETAIGPLKFKRNGTPSIYHVTVLQWRNGQNVVVWPRKWSTGRHVPFNER